MKILIRGKNMNKDTLFVEFIKGLKFACTCFGCPEQYDVFDSNDNIVGYVRLRWGKLTCQYPDVDGELIYEASVGDGWCGNFESDKQRMKHLNNIVDRILVKMNERDDEDDEWNY